MADSSARLPPQSLLRLTHFWLVPAASSVRGSRRAVPTPGLSGNPVPSVPPALRYASLGADPSASQMPVERNHLSLI